MENNDHFNYFLNCLSRKIDQENEKTNFTKSNMSNLSMKFIKKYENNLDWHILSNCSLPLTEKIIEEYKNRWNWYNLSANQSLPWSEELIEKYKDRRDWDALSANKSLSWSEKLIEKHKDKRDWYNLSANRSLPWSEELIEKYKNNWIREEQNIEVCGLCLSANQSLPWSEKLIEKYKDKWGWGNFGLSANESLPWSEKLIGKYKDKRYRGALSANQSLPWSEKLIEKYKDKWYWTRLYENSKIDKDMIDFNPLVFLDTETTELENPKIIQLAYKYDGKYFNQLYGTDGVSISIESMTIHNITEEMINGKPSFDSSADKNTLQNILKNNILVAHNAIFDINVLKNHGVYTYEYIDTLKIARYLRPELEQHNEQYLRYYFKLQFDKKIDAHDALSDIKVLEKIFEKMMEEFRNRNRNKEKTDLEIYDDMIIISKKPSLLYKCGFGKHKGLLRKDVPNDYLEWILNQSDITDENIRYTAESYYN